MAGNDKNPFDPKLSRRTVLKAAASAALSPENLLAHASKHAGAALTAGTPIGTITSYLKLLYPEDNWPDGLADFFSTPSYFFVKKIMDLKFHKGLSLEPKPPVQQIKAEAVTALHDYLQNT